MSTLAIILLIYFIGYVISYLVCKRYRALTGQNTWEDVSVTLGYSSLSWVFLIYLILDNYFNINRFFDNEPPKWM